MTRSRAAFETIHLTLLGIWAGAIAATGLAAAVAFPIMKRLDPSLPGFAGYPEDHWRIAAGQVMNPVFQGVATFGVLAGVVALLALVIVVVRVRPRVRCGLVWVRVLATSGALICVSISTALVQRPMQTELAKFIDSARAGDVSAADGHREAFDRFHPVASNLMKLNLVLVVVAFGAGVWNVARPDGSESTGAAS